MGNLAQLSTVKNRLGISDTTDDTLLTNFIKFASGRFERQCNRLFDRQANTMEEFGAAACEFRVSRYPIESVSNFHLKVEKSTDDMTAIRMIGAQQAGSLRYSRLETCATSEATPRRPSAQAFLADHFRFQSQWRLRLKSSDFSMTTPRLLRCSAGRK